MPFNTLLLTSLSFDTGFEQKGEGKDSRVSMEPLKDERVLFFIIDSDIVRQNLNIQGEVCDCLVFYARRGEEKKVLCLVESKGKDLEHAVKQIINTHQCLNKSLKCRSCQYNEHHLHQVTWKAYIRISRFGSTPQMTKRLENQLQATFGKKGHGYDIKERGDLGLFLRK